MGTGKIIGISVLSLLAIGGVIVAITTQSDKEPLKATSTTTSEATQVQRGGVVSAFKGILDGLKVSLA